MSKQNSKKSSTPRKVVEVNEEEKQEELKICLSIVKEMMRKKVLSWKIQILLLRGQECYIPI